MPRPLTPMQREALSDLVGLHEIAARLGVSRKAVWNWTDRTSTAFPAPVLELAAGRFWRWSEVQAWSAARNESE